MAKKLDILSWNINGIRAIERKGFFDWLEERNPDVLGLQEIKADHDKIPERFRAIDGYFAFFNPAQRPGYSGTALFSKIKPDKVGAGFGVDKFDVEGRVIWADFDDTRLYNVYFPNGKMNETRLQYKMDFYDAFLAHIQKVQKQGRKVVFCGDVNTAHKPIDLARPKENEKISGFLPMEREWIDEVIEKGFTDTFRAFHPNKTDEYSWWAQRSRARERNVGWRIDYFFTDEKLTPNVKKAFIEQETQGSDHAPVGISLSL